MAKLYKQVYGIDYLDTLILVVKMVIVRIVLALALAYRWSPYQVDVVTMFFEGDLYEEVYMHTPEGHSNWGGNRVCKLLKSLYELK